MGEWVKDILTASTEAQLNKQIQDYKGDRRYNYMGTARILRRWTDKCGYHAEMSRLQSGVGVIEF